MTRAKRKPSTITTICLHAFMNTEEGGSTYVDEDHLEEGERVDGWSVYTRTDAAERGEDTGEFDLSDEKDFATYEEALAEGEARATRHDVELQEY